MTCRDIWLEVISDFPTVTFRIRDVKTGEIIMSAPANQAGFLIWERIAAEPLLDSVNIVGFQMRDASWTEVNEEAA